MAIVTEGNSQRSIIRQHPERAVPDEADQILAEGLVAHVAYTKGEQPFVIPFAYHFDPAEPNTLYLHGGHSSATLGHLKQGEPVCVTVTLVDGLVFSRTALYHSMNYRSAVCFGRARTIHDAAEKQRIFEKMTERYFPGRQPGLDYESAPLAHLDATSMIEITLEEKSAKARRGGPKGPSDSSLGSPGTCGVISIRQVWEREFESA